MDSSTIDSELQPILRQRRDDGEGSRTSGDSEKDASFFPSESLMFAVTGVVIMVASLSFDFSEAHPCKLKTALDSIHLKNTTNLCKYNTINDIAKAMYSWSWSLFIWNSYLVILSPYIYRFVIRRYPSFPIIFYTVFFVGSIVFSYKLLDQYKELQNAQSKEVNIAYYQLQSSMISELETRYTSDNLSSGDTYSKAWNDFFMEYDCCAVREVQGTTNDFVNTPWCTTNGSCHANTSTIPRTCCKDVTPNDYQNAPPACYASVVPGTFKQSCISRIRALSVSSVDEGSIHTLQSYVYAVGIYQALILAWNLMHVYVKLFECLKTIGRRLLGR